ncbi:MAG TPA: GrpB family protein [bacterium]|nr:GrpB family protein [bacterium]
MADRPTGYDPQNDAIEIVDYDPDWPVLYLKEEGILRGVLAAFGPLSIEHFGSTSVPGLAAKPILDIMVSVASRDLWPSLVQPLQNLGYSYWRDNPQENEMFFVKGMPPYGERRTHHVHIYDRQGMRWKRELAFRDHLRREPEAARCYERLKKELAAKFTFDREAYTQGKGGFIEETLVKITQG